MYFSSDNSTGSSESGQISYCHFPYKNQKSYQRPVVMARLNNLAQTSDPVSVSPQHHCYMSRLPFSWPSAAGSPTTVEPIWQSKATWVNTQLSKFTLKDAVRVDSRSSSLYHSFCIWLSDPTFPLSLDKNFYGTRFQYQYVFPYFRLSLILQSSIISSSNVHVTDFGSKVTSKATAAGVSLSAFSKNKLDIADASQERTHFFDEKRYFLCA